MILQSRFTQLKKAVEEAWYWYEMQIYYTRMEAGWGRPQPIPYPCEEGVKPIRTCRPTRRRPKPSYLEFFWTQVKHLLLQKWNLTCWWFGHDIRDCSSAGPESGDMDHHCRRCGRYWHIQLY